MASRWLLAFARRRAMMAAALAMALAVAAAVPLQRTALAARRAP